MLSADTKKRLTELVTQPVLWECPMASYTSFGIGGNATAIVSVVNEDEVQSVLSFCEQESVQYRVIGKGTNLIVSDDGFTGIVLLLEGSLQNIERLDSCSEGTTKISAGAGASLTAVNKFCMKNGLSGAEFSYGIPGTVGGATVMNAGAWGGEISDIVESVSLVTSESRITLSGDELNFKYRLWSDYYSKFKNSVVTSVVLNCVKKTKEEVEANCRQILEKRKAAQPIKLPNAGSFFKNPAEGSAGYLIDQCGLKGYRIGNVMVSMEHANFFVNLGGGTAKEVKELMKYVQKKVVEKYQVALKPEVHFI